MTGVEQQRGAALDADIAQAQKQRAVRLAVALDAKQRAAGVGAFDLRLEILVPPAPAKSLGGGGKGRGGNQDEYKNGESSHDLPARFIMCQGNLQQPTKASPPHGVSRPVP
jgi:hypothetical protein